MKQMADYFFLHSLRTDSVSMILVRNLLTNKNLFPLYFRVIFLLAAAVPCFKVANPHMRYLFRQGGIS